jgi:hypothetical protein
LTNKGILTAKVKYRGEIAYVSKAFRIRRSLKTSRQREEYKDPRTKQSYVRVLYKSIRQASDFKTSNRKEVTKTILAYFIGFVRLLYKIR